MDLAIRNCPFCGSSNVRVKHSSRWGYFVSCECAAVGPSATSKTSAIGRWNTRIDGKQYGVQSQMTIFDEMGQA